MDGSLANTFSIARKIAMKMLSILTLLVCSDCRNVIQQVLGLISDSEDKSKSDK